MKRLSLLCLFTLCLLNLKSQEEVIRPGLIKAMATISPSKMFGYNESYFYLHGNLEGYLSKNVTVAGEGYLFLGEQTSAMHAFQFNHNLFFGMSYHIIKGNSDLYFGIQPGVGIAQLKTDSVKVPVSHTGVDPVFSAIAGYNYFVGKYFNFFIQTRFIAGEHNYDKHKTLSEIRFSAGLGFNFNTVKSKSVHCGIPKLAD